MLIWILGGVKESRLHMADANTMAGVLTLEHARVRWFLSIDPKKLPAHAGARTYRSITVDGKEVEFTEGFTDLHTVSCQHILAGEFARRRGTPILSGVSVRTAQPLSSKM